MTTSDDDIELDYGYLTQKSLRIVIRDVLEITAGLGRCPGEHHFYIEFDTTHPGVAIADFLREEFPERMMIVLQHKFEELTVEEDYFSVVLHFKSVPETLVVPYDAITSFHDPSTEYQLRFELVEMPANEDEHDAEAPSAEMVDLPVPDKAPNKKTGQKKKNPEEGDENGDAEVVSLDSFRKKE